MPAKQRIFAALTEQAQALGLPAPSIKQTNDRGDGYIEVPTGPVRIHRRIFYNLALLIRFDKHGRLWRHIAVYDMTPREFFSTDTNLFNHQHLNRHPHIGHVGGSMCQDRNALTNMWQALSDENYSLFYSLLLLLVGTYNPGSPHNRMPGLMPCYHPGCEADGEHHCPSCRTVAACTEHCNRCTVCNNHACEACSRPSQQTPDRVYHTVHNVLVCHSCNRERAREESIACNSCERRICTGCYNRAQSCSACYSMVCGTGCLRHRLCRRCVDRVSQYPSHDYGARVCANRERCRNGPLTLPAAFYARRGDTTCLDCVANPPDQIPLPMVEAGGPAESSEPAVELARAPEIITRTPQQEET